MSFFSRKNHSTSIILDIGSGSVAGALVLLEGESSSILYSLRIPITVSKKNSDGRLLQGMLKATEDIVKSLIHEAHNLHSGKIHEVTCFLSSPWYVSRVHTSVIERAEPVTITESFLDDVLNREAQDFTVALKQEEREQILSGKVILMENKTLSVSLNGYKVNNPYGKKARNVKVSSYVSLISSEIKQKLESVVYAFTHTKNLTFSSFPITLYSFVRKFFPHEEEYALFDITAEMTDMILVEEGEIVVTEAFSQGRNTLVRKVAESFDVGPDLALSFIHLYAQKKMESELLERMEKIILEVRTEWTAAFKDLFENSKKLFLPRKIFITADEGVGTIFIDFLTKNSILKKEASVIVLDGNVLADMSQVKGGVTDPFLLIESAYTGSQI